MAAAGSVYGAPFRTVLASARVWVNGDEVAVLPPVSGG